MNSTEPLFTLQAGMEALAAKAVVDSGALKNCIKRQPLCLEAMSILEDLQKSADGLQQLLAAYRKQLSIIASKECRDAA